MKYIFILVLFAAFLAVIRCDDLFEISNSKKVNIREKLYKSTNGRCLTDQFSCFNNNKCIERRYFCNNRNDCGDNSDESYCQTRNNCPRHQEFIRCGRDSYSTRCVPKSWECDGVEDCIDGQDEKGCDNQVETRSIASRLSRAKFLARKWILKKRDVQNPIQKWGVDIPRISVALYFSENVNVTRNDSYVNELAYELSNELLSKLALRKLDEIKTSELANYVNGFLAFCINPRKFFVVDLIGELRKRVDARKTANPYAVLALCNAGEFITETDIEKLRIAFLKAQEEHRIDAQAFIVMALACASSQLDSSFDREELSEYTMEIKRKQYRNGTVENIKTTALVLQALFASEPEPDEDNFDEEKAIKQILRSQEKDGSFGGQMNTYYVLPILSMTSLANISSKHCPKLTITDNEGLEFLQVQVGDKWNITYSIWIGDDKVLQRILTLSVPANTSFYGVMEYAAGVDEKYKFEYNVRNRKPYIFSLSGIMDDPEKEMFWYPYSLSNSSQPILISQSPADMIPNNNEHIIFWYRSMV